MYACTQFLFCFVLFCFVFLLLAYDALTKLAGGFQSSQIRHTHCHQCCCAWSRCEGIRCVCECVYLSVCICVFVLCAHVLCLGACTVLSCTYVCMYVCMCVCVCVCVCLCVFVCVCVYLYLCISFPIYQNCKLKHFFFFFSRN